MTDRSRRPFLLLALLLAACDPAEDVEVQPLPSLARSSVEARLGLPEVRGAWRFAGWELQEGDTLGLDAELASYGIVWLPTQQRDSVAGFYVTSGGRAPLFGEVRRNGVLSLVTFLAPGDGRYLVGDLQGDTLWVETTSLSDSESWREGARAAFVRSQQPVTPFRRVRGALPPPPPVDSAALAALDSARAAAAAAAAAGAGAQPGGVTTAPGVGQGTGAPAAGAATPTRPVGPPAAQPPVARPPVTQPPAARPPVTQPPVEAEPEEEEEPEPEPEPQPAPVQQREPPRVLGEPVVRDTAGGQRP